MALPEPTRIRGVDYPSMSAAARALGVTIMAVRHAVEEGNPDRVGTGNSQPRPFAYNGKQYRSQAACARAYGVNPSTFDRRVLQGVDPVTGERITHTPPQTRP